MGGSAINVFSVFLVFAGVGSVGIIVGGGVGRLSPMVSSSSSVNCSSCCGWWKVGAVVGVAPVVVFSVNALCSVFVAIGCIFVINIIAGELSSAASVASLVVCGSCWGLGRVGALTVNWAGSQL